MGAILDFDALVHPEISRRAKSSERSTRPGFLVILISLLMY
jgi:hypothetical protein